MAWRSYKRDIDKVYRRIDKIAKKGRDNSQEYYNYVDSMILKSQYGLLTQVLNIKYDFNWDKYTSALEVKQRSWLEIMFRTNTSIQDGKQSLMNSRGIYQVGLTYYKELPYTIANVVDTTGSGAVLDAVVTNGGVYSINITKPGQNYSTSSTISIIGGVTPATAVIPAINGVRGGRIIDINIVATGSFHNQDTELGTISETDVYAVSVEGVSQREYQEVSGNKQTHLSVLLTGTTSVATFSTWGTQSSYDRNLLALYVEAFDYMV